MAALQEEVVSLAQALEEARAVQGEAVAEARQQIEERQAEVAVLLVI